MKLPSELEFHDDLHLLIYRPHGVIDEASVKKIVYVLEDLEAKLQKPFNRFFDTLGADEVELNFKYVIQVSLCRRLVLRGPSTGEVGNSCCRCNNDSLRSVACRADSRFANSRACLSKIERKRRMAGRTARAANNGSPDEHRQIEAINLLSSNAFVVDVLAAAST